MFLFFILSPYYILNINLIYLYLTSFNYIISDNNNVIDKVSFLSNGMLVGVGSDKKEKSKYTITQVQGNNILTYHNTDQNTNSDGDYCQYTITKQGTRFRLDPYHPDDNNDGGSVLLCPQ